ncbi:MAG: 4a-hydroxytetrahydrobiopterin dehydratase [Burkholderiaceae bacterium]
MKAVIPRQQLLAKKSRPIVNERPYTGSEIEVQLLELPGWSFRDGFIERSYAFRDYYDTIAFVNALAWMVHGEDHHPELLVHYNRCTVRFNTHSVNGVSENDFICAAKTDAVFGRVGN